MDKSKGYLRLECRNCGNPIPFIVEAVENPIPPCSFNDAMKEVSKILAYEQKNDKHRILMQYVCSKCNRAYFYSSKDVFFEFSTDQPLTPIRVPWPPSDE